MFATWQCRTMPAMKSLSESKLQKMFVIPKFKFIVPDKPLYHELHLEKSGKVEYSNNKPHLMLFHTDKSDPKPNDEMLWLWYTSAKGGSAVSYGPTFMYDPQVAAQQISFWVPLERWCCFEQTYEQFQKSFTIGFCLEKDNVPIKTKRIWIRKFAESLSNYTKGSKQ